MIARTVGALDALSTIQALPAGDLPGAYRRSREIAALNEDWVSVELARVRDGTVLFDLRRPLSAGPRPNGDRTGPPETRVAGVVRSGRGCPCIAFERGAPGPDGGTVLTVLVSLEPFARLLPRPSGDYAVSAIVGHDGRFIARSRDHAARVGTPASTYVHEAIAGG